MGAPTSVKSPTHLEKVAQWIGAGKIGTEIGAGQSPVPGLVPPPFYVDCFKEFGGEATRADFYGHASALPFHDNSLDYVVASHVLEHVANPVAAFAEWYRVLRPGGIIYLVVPDRRLTWDHTRELTPVAHLLDDYVRHTTPCDPTHVDDYVFRMDWARHSPDVTPDELPAKQEMLARGMHEAIGRGEEINIHFHTFELSSLLELFETLRTWPTRRFNWQVVDQAEHFPATTPNGVLVVLRVKKTWTDRAAADWFRIQIAGNSHGVVRPDAEPFSVFYRNTAGLGGVR